VAPGDTLTITAPSGNAGTYTIAGRIDASNIYLTESAGADASGTIEATLTPIDANGALLQTGTPGTDAGTKYTVDDFYNGLLLRVYNATTGVPQVREIVDYYQNPGDSAWYFRLRHAFVPLPTGTASYEICPILPLQYDSIFAMDVAIRNSTRRSGLNRRAGLRADRSDLWNACYNYYSSLVADRAPARMIPPRYDEVEPYE